MNNVMNRKMFRPRNARNKLNAMGGIMASSAPLMQTVQKFANGSTPQGVRPGPSTISKFGQVMTPTGYGVSSSFPYNRTTAPQTNPAVQNVIANNLAAQRALNAGIADMPATGLMSPAMARLRAAEARGPGFMDFLNRVGEDAKILFGGTNQEIVDATRRKLGIESVVVPKTREGAELDELTPLTADMPSIYGNKQAMSAIAGDEVATQSIAAQGSDQLAPTQQPLSRMGAEDEDVFTQDVGSLSILGDRDLAQAGAEDEDAFTEEGEVSQGKSDPVFTDDEDPYADQPSPSGKTTPSITEQVNPSATAAAIAVEKVQPTNKASVKKVSTDIGARIMEFVQNNDVDGAEEVAASAFGADEAAESGAQSTEDRINRQRDIIAKVMGVDPEQYKQNRGMAIANFGFALMNKGIGEAGQQLVADLKANNAAQRAREDKISSAAISTVLGREEKESDRQFTREMKKIDYAHDWRKLGKVESGKQSRLIADMNFRGYINDVNNALKLDLKDKDIEEFNTRLKADSQMLSERIASAEKIASANNVSQDARNQATIEANNARAVLSGLGDGTKLALIEGQQNGLSGTELNNFVSTRAKELATTDTLTGPDSLRRLITTIVPTIMKEEGVGYDEAVGLVLYSENTEQFFAKDLAALGITPNQDSSTVGVTKDPNTLSGAELKNLWDSGARIITFDGVNYPLENPDG